jgi:type IV secretory pathway TraG/TraD family ATPase VirD4
MRTTEILDGNKLQPSPISMNIPDNEIKCAFLGQGFDGKSAFVPFNNDLLSRHILFLGGIGTGKTNAFFQLIKQLRHSLNEDDVMIIFDSKGDFHELFADPGDIVISNDNRARGKNGVDYWNIFNEIENDDHMEENIIEVANVLFQDKIEKTSQPFFPNAAKGIFTAILTHQIRSGQGNMNNKTLREFLDRSPTAEIRTMLNSYPDFKSMVSYIADDRSPQTQGVMSELQTTIREIFIGNFKKEGSLSIRNLVREKKGRKIFIEYDLAIGAMLTPIYKLMFDMAIKEALSVHKTKGNVWLITDEFKLLPNLKHIDDAVNFGRGQGIKLMVGIQNISQIYEAYGEERAKSILSGLLTTVCFRVNDGDSREFIKNIHGKNIKQNIYNSVQTHSLSENIKDSYVVEDWDISRLGLGEAIIGLPGQEPFLFKFNKA